GGTPKRGFEPKLRASTERGSRACGSSGSKHAITSSTVEVSCGVSANTEMQSSDLQAGTTPRVLIKPRVGFSPIILLKAAGTRPEPAVSVPSAKLTSPAATATAEPELEPPGICWRSSALAGTPNGERVPFRPVANWSRLVLPIGM